MDSSVIRSSQYSGRILKRKVQRKSRKIHDWLNFDALVPEILHPSLRFLTKREIDQLNGLSTQNKKATQLLLILDRKPPYATRRFIAALKLEPEHCGHRDIAKSVMRTIPQHEVEEINRMVVRIRADRESPTSSTRSSPAPDQELQVQRYSPERPMPQIELTGHLKGDEFEQLDRRLWLYFSTGQYDNLGTLVERIRSDYCYPADWKIIAMWFESLIVMHRDGDYGRCIGELLLPAYTLCDDSESENKIILKGRICQRMAQIYLVMGVKDLAMKIYEQAKEHLQFVGRGYDRANMFCREAKLLSATSLERRDHIEDMYSNALECAPEAAPFALASRPSLLLSKTAFHLHMSFGSKPRDSSSQSVPLPDISTEDLKKAKDTLECLPKDMIVLTMRKCEHKLLSAELLRLDGKTDEAVTMFQDTIADSEAAKLKNLVAIANCRIRGIEEKEKHKSLLGRLMEGLP